MCVKIIKAMADVAQLVRALVCGTGGRGFESHHSPQVNLSAKLFFYLTKNIKYGIILTSFLPRRNKNGKNEP